MLALLAFGLGVAYAVDGQLRRDRRGGPRPGADRHRPGHLGWIIRIVVFLAYLLVPVVINAVTPLVNYEHGLRGPVRRPSWPSQSHPTVVAAAKVPMDQVATDLDPAAVLAAAKTDAARLANAPVRTELIMIQAARRCSPSWPPTPTQPRSRRASDPGDQGRGGAPRASGS